MRLICSGIVKCWQLINVRRVYVVDRFNIRLVGWTVFLLEHEQWAFKSIQTRELCEKKNHFMLVSIHQNRFLNVASEMGCWALFLNAMIMVVYCNWKKTTNFGQINRRWIFYDSFRYFLLNISLIVWCYISNSANVQINRIRYAYTCFFNFLSWRTQRTRTHSRAHNTIM